MSPQNDVNRQMTVPTRMKQGQLIFALDSSFVAPNLGTLANRAQGGAGCQNAKGRGFQPRPQQQVDIGETQAVSDFTRADRRDILRASVFL